MGSSPIRPLATWVVPEARSEPGRATAVVEEPRPSSEVEVRPAPLYAPAATRGRWAWGQPILVSTSGLCIAAAVVLAVMVGAFAVGFRSGFAKGDARATRELSLAATPLTDPLKANGPAGTGVLEPAPTSREPLQRSGPGQSRPTAGLSGSGQQGGTSAQPLATISSIRAVLSPPEPDARQAGLNYYAIVGQLDRESAQQIAVFLAEHGVAALAVDTGGRAGNNQRSWRVYGLQGMTGPELRSPARTDYEQRISQLGVIWKRDHRGWTDFSQTNWERYQP